MTPTKLTSIRLKEKDVHNLSEVRKLLLQLYPLTYENREPSISEIMQIALGEMHKNLSVEFAKKFLDKPSSKKKGNS